MLSREVLEKLAIEESLKQIDVPADRVPVCKVCGQRGKLDKSAPRLKYDFTCGHTKISSFYDSQCCVEILPGDWRWGVTPDKSP